MKVLDSSRSLCYFEITGVIDMSLNKFSAQADEKLLKDIKKLAKKEGKYLFTIINEAFEDLLKKRRLGNQRRAALEQFEESLQDYASVYEKLAK